MLNLQTIRMRSLFSGRTTERVIAYENTDLHRFLAGMSIDEAMPYLSSADKMFLTLGITPKEASIIKERKRGYLKTA